MISRRVVEWSGSSHTAGNQSNDMAESIEEEQVSVGVGLDQHHHTRRDDGEKANNVGHSNAVEDDVASTRQVFW